MSVSRRIVFLSFVFFNFILVILIVLEQDGIDPELEKREKV